MKSWKSLTFAKIRYNGSAPWIYSTIWIKEDGWCEGEVGVFWYGKYR